MADGIAKTYAKEIQAQVLPTDPRHPQTYTLPPNSELETSVRLIA